jgi:O-antigen/teichoic acid export membrane protein
LLTTTGSNFAVSDKAAMSLRTQTLTLAISNLGTALLSFLLAALIARLLGEVGLGTYAVALAWVTPLSLLVEFGIGTLISREIASGAVEDSGGQEWRLYSATQGDLVAAAVHARLWMGVPLMLVLVVAAPLLTSDGVVARGIQVSAPLVVIQPLFSTYSAVFRGRGVMYPIPWLNIGMLVAQVGLTFAVVGTPFMASPAPTSSVVIDALLVNTITSAGQMVACWAIYRARFYVRAMGSRQSAMAILRESWNFGLAALFAAVQMRMSPVLLEAMSGIAAAGLYAGANRFVEAARLLPNAFYGALFPSLGTLSADPAQMRRIFRRALLAMFAYGIASALVISLLAQALLTLVYGAAFAAAVPALVVLSAAFVFSLLRGTLTLYHYARRREAFVNRVNLGVIGVQFAFSLWLIPQMGAHGAAWTVLGAEAFALIALGFLAPPDARTL